MKPSYLASFDGVKKAIKTEGRKITCGIVSSTCVAWKRPSLPVMSLTWSRRHLHSRADIHICSPPLPSTPHVNTQGFPTSHVFTCPIYLPRVHCRVLHTQHKPESLPTCPSVSLCPRDPTPKTHQTSGFATTSSVILSARDSQPPLGDSNGHLFLVPALVRMGSPTAYVDHCEQSYPLSVAWRVLGLPGP